jgi:predicted MFS family arabinose efflux permease
MFGGQYLGIALGGGGAIYVSSLWGFNSALVFVSCLLMLNFVFIALFITDPAVASPDAKRKTGRFAHFIATLGAFVRSLYDGFMLSGRGPKVGLLFAILPVGAMALGYAILGSFQVDYGLTQAQIAQVSILNTVAGGIGCLIGGFLGDKFGMKKFLGVFYFLTVIPTLYLAFKVSTLGINGISIEGLYIVIVFHGLVYGAAFALHAAIFMGMTSPAVAATQFTAYMAISNLAISAGNLWQGAVAERMGYEMALSIDAAFVVVALAVIPFLKNREETVKTIELEPATAIE